MSASTEKSWEGSIPNPEIVGNSGKSTENWEIVGKSPSNSEIGRIQPVEIHASYIIISMVR